MRSRVIGQPECPLDRQGDGIIASDNADALALGMTGNERITCAEARRTFHEAATKP